MMRGGGMANRPRALVCYICGREYGTTSLKIHLKTCEKKFMQEQSLRPRNQQKPLPRPPANLIPFLGEGQVPKDAYKKIDQYNEQAFDDWNSKMLDQCINCGRTFRPEALVKHQKSCTSQNPTRGVNKNPVQQTRGGPQQSYQRGSQQSYNQQSFQQPEEYASVQLIPCTKCGRSFQNDRIQKHQSICKGNKPQRMTRHQKELQMKEQQRKQYDKYHKQPKNNWRARHNELQEAMSYMRKVNAVEQRGGDIRKIAPPKTQQSMYADYVQCPHCSRKFNQQAAERHIPKCKTTIAKPKPVGSYTQTKRLPVSKQTNYGKSNVSAFRDCIVPGSKQAQNIQRQSNGVGSYGGGNSLSNPNKSIKIGNSNTSSFSLGGGRYF